MSLMFVLVVSLAVLSCSAFDRHRLHRKIDGPNPLSISNEDRPNQIYTQSRSLQDQTDDGDDDGDPDESNNEDIVPSIEPTASISNSPTPEVNIVDSSSKDSQSPEPTGSVTLSPTIEATTQSDLAEPTSTPSFDPLHMLTSVEPTSMPSPEPTRVPSLAAEVAVIAVTDEPTQIPTPIPSSPQPSLYPTLAPVPDTAAPTMATVAPTLPPVPADTQVPTSHVPTPTPKCLNCGTESPTISLAPTPTYNRNGVFGITYDDSQYEHVETMRIASIGVLLFTLAGGMTYWGWLRSQRIIGSRKLQIDEEEYQSDHSSVALNVMHDYSSDPKPHLEIAPRLM
eukprot:gene11740-24623_t